MNDNSQDDTEHPVTIITGRVWKRKGGTPEGVHVMLVAPDEDSAVRKALDALATEGYAEAELDQIGEMEGEPDDEPYDDEPNVGRSPVFSESFNGSFSGSYPADGEDDAGESFPEARLRSDWIFASSSSTLGSLCSSSPERPVWPV